MRHLLSHPEQGTEIVAAVADVDDLLKVVHLLSVLFQPVLQFVTLAHVDQAPDLACVLVRGVGGNTAANHETVLVFLGPVRGVCDDSVEKRGQVMFLSREREGERFSTCTDEAPMALTYLQDSIDVDLVGVRNANESGVGRLGLQRRDGTLHGWVLEFEDGFSFTCVTGSTEFH